MVSKFRGYRFSHCGSSREGDMKVMLRFNEGANQNLLRKQFRS